MTKKIRARMAMTMPTMVPMANFFTVVYEALLLLVPVEKEMPAAATVGRLVLVLSPTSSVAVERMVKTVLEEVLSQP